MQFRMIGRGRRGLALLAALGVVGIAGVRAARASDHQDNPLVELNPAMDMSDVYAFPGSAADRIVLVLNSRPLLTPASTPSASFDPNILYQFKIDNTGDAKEDRVIQVIFKGTGATQTVEVRGPIAPPVSGGMMNTVADVAPAVTGAINQVTRHARVACRCSPARARIRSSSTSSSSCGSSPIASRRRARCPRSRMRRQRDHVPRASAAVDVLKGLNLLSIVIELPTSQLTAGGNAKLGVWGTISR